MMSMDLAPNDTFQDALKSLIALAQPWRWIKGPDSMKAKVKLKRFFPKHEGFFYLSARGALYKLFQALKLKTGDEVVVLGFTCEAVVLPIRALKLTPVFADLETESFSFDLTDLKRKITKNTKVLILQHSYGATPKHRLEIIKLAKQFDIRLVEDLAHGFDQTLFKKDEHETIKLLSFGRAKALSSVFGGAIMTTDQRLAEELKRYDKRLLRPKLSFIVRCLLYKPLSVIIKNTYSFLSLGKVLHWITVTIHLFPKELTEKEKKGSFNEAMTHLYPNALASLLNYQLKNYESMQELRRQNVREYNSVFHTVERVQPLSRYPVLVKNRDEFMKQLYSDQIYLSRWYHKLVSPAHSCPTADVTKDSILNLPTHIPHSQIQSVMKKVELHNFKMQD